MRTLINVRIPSSYGFETYQNLWKISVDNNGYIELIDQMKNEKVFNGEDWQGDWISPRGIDLQINGGLGISFTDIDIDKIPTIPIGERY